MAPEPPPEPPRGRRPRALGAELAWWWGALAAMGAYPIHRLVTMVASQVEAPRALGLLAVLAGTLLVPALLLAVAARALPKPGPRAATALGAAFWAVVLLNLGLIGLQVFFQGPSLAPRPWLLAALAVPLALAAAFSRYGAAERAWLVGGAVRVGQAAVVAPLLALPWVAWAAWHDEPRLPIAPVLPADAAVRPDAPRRIVLVTFDALRFQATSLADPGLATTPHLAALAREGTAFVNARAASDQTAIAMPAIGTGVRPGRFFRWSTRPGALARAGFMDGLAGHLAPAGYRAGAYMMGVSPMTIGFDGEFEDVMATVPSFAPNFFNTRAFLPIGPAWGFVADRALGRAERPDRRLWNNLFATREAFARAHRFLAASPGRAFAWIHVGVPHTPMADIPPPADLADPEGAGFRWVTEEMLAAATPAQMAAYREVYHRYARFGDAELGRFVAALKASGLYDDALIVVGADHGEDLRTPAHATHAMGVLNERVARVPLVVRPPRGGAGRVDDRLASMLDVAPTVLDAVYTRLPAGLSGAPLGRPAPADRIVYVWALQARWFPAPGMHASAAAYEGRHKYLLHWAPGATAPAETLHDVAVDPEGTTDLRAARPEVFARLRAALARDNVLGP